MAVCTQGTGVRSQRAGVGLAVLPDPDPGSSMALSRGMPAGRAVSALRHLPPGAQQFMAERKIVFNILLESMLRLISCLLSDRWAWGDWCWALSSVWSVAAAHQICRDRHVHVLHELHPNVGAWHGVCSGKVTSVYARPRAALVEGMPHVPIKDAMSADFNGLTSVESSAGSVRQSDLKSWTYFRTNEEKQREVPQNEEQEQNRDV